MDLQIYSIQVSNALKTIDHVGVEVLFEGNFYIFVATYNFTMRKIAEFFLLIFFVLSLSTLQAQPGPPTPGEPPCGGPFGPACPIDGGVSLLIAAGVAYGGKKSYDMARNKQ